MEEKTRIIDISLPIKTNMVVYPGNAPVDISVWHSIGKGDSSNLSRIDLGSHTGTHIDAPFHNDPSGKTLGQIPLQIFFGRCKVFDFSNSQKCVSLEDLRSKDIKKGDRILLKTSNSFRGLEEFYDDYVYLDGDGAEYLAEQGVLLVGIDSLSIKQRGSKDNRPHSALLSKDIPIIEGINLKEVSEGEYIISAFPISVDIDGAPIRAVLIKK